MSWWRRLTGRGTASDSPSPAAVPAPARSASTPRGEPKPDAPRRDDARAPSPLEALARGEPVDPDRHAFGPCPNPDVPPRRVGLGRRVLVGDGLFLVGGALIARGVILIPLRGRLVRV